MESVIELRKLRRSFRNAEGRAVLALDLPSLSVARGQGLVITGPNGAGKSTLLHLIAGLLRPDSGALRVLGKDLWRLDHASLDRFRAASIGCLLQESPLLDFLSAEDNILAARAFHGQGHMDSTGALLERFGLAHRARHRPTDLSGGERQRLALAVAFANDPPILLADEPASNLDPRGRELVRETLARAREAEGRTVIVVSHHQQDLPRGFDLFELAAPGAAS